MGGGRGAIGTFDPRDTFEEVGTSINILSAFTSLDEARFIRLFREAAARSANPKLLDGLVVERAVDILTTGVSPLFQRLNVFLQKLARTSNPELVASRIKEDCRISESNPAVKEFLSHSGWPLETRFVCAVMGESKRRDALVPWCRLSYTGREWPARIDGTVCNCCLSRLHSVVALHVAIKSPGCLWG